VDAGESGAADPGTARLLARSVDALALLVVSALGACLVHLLVTGTMRRILHLFSWKWWLRDQLFVSSVGYLLVFAVLAIVPSLLYVAWPRRATFARLLAFHVALATLSVLLVFSRVAPWALVLVALGAAVQVLRVAGSRERALRPRIRWLAGSLFGATALAVSVIHLIGRRAESRALASVPATREGTPNVLLIILDTVRGSSVGFLGGPVDNTPHLAELAKRGVVFEEAYSTASWTLPSHASIFTGEYASTTGADWARPLGKERQTLAEALAADGLAGGGFVANTVAAWYRTGLGRGFVHFDDTKHSLAEFALSTTLTQSSSVVRGYMGWIRTGWWLGALRSALPLSLAPRGNYVTHDLIEGERVVDDFLAWQGTLGQRPFFAFLNLFDAHEPYLPPRAFRTMYGKEGLDYDRYLGAIRYMDGEIDRALRELDRRGVLRNTIVIVTSDHGESFREHGLVGHGNGLYRNQLRVPLLIANAQGSTAGLRVDQPISLRDLPATILDLAGHPTGHSLGGRSLRPLLTEGGTVEGSPVIAELSHGINIDPRSFVGRADQKSVVRDSLHVIQSNLNTLMAFDMHADSLELDDLAGDPAVRARVLELITRTLKERRLTWQAPPR
jgi:arylsulfatase A-like enzyme/uncharacterized membrane protein